jgi:hypothetical protein
MDQICIHLYEVRGAYGDAVYSLPDGNDEFIAALSFLGVPDRSCRLDVGMSLLLLRLVCCMVDAQHRSEDFLELLLRALEVL